MNSRTSPLIDTHVHLDAFADLAAMVAEARAVGVGQFVVPGVRVGGWETLLTTVAATPGALTAPGVHPLYADQWRPELRGEFERWLDRPEAVAVGEVGLDRKSPADRETQEALFRAMIRLAIAHDKPLLIHCRGAIGRLFEILQQERANRVGGILHAYSGSMESARQAIRLNFAIGIGGIVTYPEARRLPEVVSGIDPDWLVLETDAPDLPPHPHRNRACRPADLALIAAKVAELRGWDPAETARVATANTRRVLRLAPPADQA